MMATNDSDITRDQKRSRRKREVRALSVYAPRISKEVLEVGRKLQPEVDVDRPQTRSDCVNGMRPCPFVSCRYHLYLDVSPRTGSIKLNFPDLEVWEMEHSCALDISEQGGTETEVLGEILNVTRECVRKIVQKGLDRISGELDSATPSDDEETQQELG